MSSQDGASRKCLVGPGLPQVGIFSDVPAGGQAQIRVKRVFSKTEMEIGLHETL